MKVILMSGYMHDFATRESLSGAGYPFLHKPFGAQTLAVEVHEALARRGSQ
jgi:hypothetical protein